MTNIVERNKEAILRTSMNPAMEVFDWQTIREYLNNRIEGMKLTKVQQLKLKRYQFVYDQLSSGKYTESEVVEQLQQNYEDVSLGQALQDLKCSKEIFNTTLKIDKRFEIKLQIDRMKVEQQKCVESGDSKTFAIISKVIQSYLAMLPDEEFDTGDLFKGHQNIFEFNPSLLGIEPLNNEAVQELLNELRTKHSYRNHDMSLLLDVDIIEETSNEK